MEQEEAFVRAFIVRAKQERYLQMLANPKRRRKFLHVLYHQLAFKAIPAKTTAIASHDHFPEPVEKKLKQKGAGPTCYLISPEEELDQREMPLREALETLRREDCVGVACCLAGKLAYYKAEMEGYILASQP